MTTFRFYFRDGNQKLFEAENMMCAMSYVLYILNEDARNIVKIEEV